MEQDKKETSGCSEAMAAYRLLEEELRDARRRGAPEDDILDRSLGVWNRLTLEERNLLDSEFPYYAVRPFAGAEAGKNLFWIDGIDRYVYVAPQGATRFTFSFMVNAGRLGVERHVLPVPTAVHLAAKFFDRDSLMLSSKPERGCFVTQYVWVVSLAEGETDWARLLERLRKDPHFFE